MAINLTKIGKTAEKYMQDEISIVRKTGETLDPVTLQMTATYVTVYTGKAWVSPVGDPQNTSSGSKSVYRTQYEIGIPSSSSEILPNDKVTITTTSMSSFVGRELYVHEEIIGTFSAFRRFKAYKDHPES